MVLVPIHSSGIMTIIDTISRVDVVSLLLFLQLFPRLFCQPYQSRDDSLELMFLRIHSGGNFVQFFSLGKIALNMTSTAISVQLMDGMVDYCSECCISAA